MDTKTVVVMKTIQQIKDEFAQSKGYRTWLNMLNSNIPETKKDKYINGVLILIQKECLENASNNANLNMVTNNKYTNKYNQVNYSDIGLYGIESHMIVVNKESITNEKNIIK